MMTKNAVGTIECRTTFLIPNDYRAIECFLKDTRQFEDTALKNKMVLMKRNIDKIASKREGCVSVTLFAQSKPSFRGTGDSGGKGKVKISVFADVFGMY